MTRGTGVPEQAGPAGMVTVADDEDGVVADAGDDDVVAVLALVVVVVAVAVVVVVDEMALALILIQPGHRQL